jgi:hypothetical protein
LSAKIAELTALIMAQQGNGGDEWMNERHECVELIGCMYI